MKTTTKAQLIKRLNEIPESVQILHFKIEYTDKGGYPNVIEMIMKKKKIRILRDLNRSDLSFKKDERFTVCLMQVQTCGGFERYGCDGTMEGYLFPVAVVEFENGKIMHFAIDGEIHIVGDAE